MLLSISQCTEPLPTTETYLIQNVNNTENEKPWSRKASAGISVSAWCDLSLPSRSDQATSSQELQERPSPKAHFSGLHLPCVCQYVIRQSKLHTRVHLGEAAHFHLPTSRLLYLKAESIPTDTESYPNS